MFKEFNTLRINHLSLEPFAKFVAGQVNVLANVMLHS